MTRLLKHILSSASRICTFAHLHICTFALRRICTFAHLHICTFALRCICTLVLIAALSPKAALTVYAQTTSTFTTTAYFQFSGNGRTVLYAPEEGSVSAPVVDNGTPSGTGYLWTLTCTVTTNGTQTDTTAVLKNDAGLYLRYADGAFTAVSAAASATSFTWTANTYCTDKNQYTNKYLSRQQLLIPGSTTEAVGVRAGKLQAVKANSRFAQVYLAESAVAGPDLPELPSEILQKHYYNILMYWLNQPNNINYISASSTMITGGTASNANAQWRLVETGDMGNFLLKSKDGYYMKQASAANFYTRTTERSEAVEFQLVDAVDQGTVQFMTDGNTTLSGATWADFWQLRNSANGYYIYEGGGGKFGGTSNTFSNSAQGGPAVATYCGGINRCKFADQGRTGKYLQFTGQGRYALYEKDGAVSAVDVQTDSIPSDLGYQWQDESSTNGYRLKNGNGRYLTVATDGTFTATATAANATEFNINADTYYAAEGLTRYNLQPVGNTTQALGVDERGQLALVAAASRYAAVGVFEVIKGPDRLILDSCAYTMSTFWASGTGYSHVKAVAGKTTDYVIGNQNTTRDAFTSPSFSNFPYQWIPVSTNDGTGDFRLYSPSGYWLTLSAKNAYAYTFTTDSTKASRLRLVDAVEKRDSIWVNFWQIKNVDSGFNTFMFYGYGNALGGTGNNVPEDASNGMANGKGAYNNLNNRIAFVPAEVGSSYIYFSALGSVPLCDNAQADGVPCARNGITHSDDRCARWTVKYFGHYCTLHSANGRYITYNETDGFGTDTLEANAYRFMQATNTYENNGNFRFEFLSADGTKALSADYQGTEQETYALKLATPGTRYSTLRFYVMLNSPVYPQYTHDGLKAHSYRIFTNASQLVILDGSTDSSDGQALATDSLATHRASTFKKQDNANNFWYFEPYDTTNDNGDVYLRSNAGRYFAYDATNSRCITTTDKSAAARVRLVENDAKYLNWQIEIVDSSLGTNNVVYYNNGTFAVGSPNQDASYFVVEPIDLRPTFYEAEGGALRFLEFIHVDDTPYISNGTSSSSTPTTVTGTTTSSITQRCWTNIGTSSNFVLRAADGTFLTYDAEAQTYTTVADTAAATHFALTANYYAGNYVVWSFVLLTRNADGTYAAPTEASQCIVRAADGTLTVGTYAEHKASADAAIYFSTQVTVNFSSAKEATYYYVTLSTDTLKFLTDNDNGAFDANGQSKLLTEYSEPYNSQLWSFSGTHMDFVMMSRDSVYLCWNKDPDVTPARFSTTINRDEAAHFYITGTDADLAANAFAVCLKSSGLDTDDVIADYIGKRLYFFTADGKTCLGLTDDAARMTVTTWGFTEAEDYSDFEILPKRSYFVYRAQSETQTLPTSIIEPDPTYGFATNAYTGKQEQDVNTYTVHHYVKDGTVRTLVLPSIMSGYDTNVRYYQRFYNYETNENFSNFRVLPTNKDSRRRYKNGTIMGSSLLLNHQTSGNFVARGFTFQMPFQTPAGYRYTIAMDASQYTDFVDYFGDSGLAYDPSTTTSGITIPSKSNLIEPTLSARYIFVMHNAREMADSMRLCLEGNNDDRWLETHTIAFPKKKVNFKNCTVPFDLQLQDYWFYNSRAAYTKQEIELANAALQNITSYSDIEFELDADHNSAGIGLSYTAADNASTTSRPMDGATAAKSNLRKARFMTFLYPKMGSDGNGVKGSYAAEGDLGMALGDSAIVKVYAVVKGDDNTDAIRYQLAKFVLLFNDASEPRPTSEVLGYTDSTATTYKDARAPLALEQKYGSARAEINFNFSSFTTYRTPPFGSSFVLKGQNISPGTEVPNTFGLPVQFAMSSYSFEPCRNNTSENTWSNENTWGSYTLVKNFKTNSSIRTHYQSAYPTETRFADAANSAFLYIDASELPGQIVSISYDGTLCQGSRLFFSAWMSTPNGTSQSAANVTFTVMGVYTDAYGKEQSDELYTYCPGPIFCQARAADGTTIAGSAGNAQWQQVYFSFINNGAHTYTHYQLAVNNACTSSNGGDIMIDDISMYALSPSVAIERTTPVCGEQVTLAKLTADFDGMLNSLGLTENDTPAGGNPYMWYCLLDKTTYDEALAANPTQAGARNAFFAALVGDPNSTNAAERAFRSVQFSTKYNELPVFDYKTIISQVDQTNTGVISRETTSTGVRSMVISDKVSGNNLKGNHKYYLVFVPRYATEAITAKNAAQQFQIGDACCVMSEFVTAASVTFLDNADSNTALDDTVRVCSNQNVNISAKMNGITTSGNIVTRVPMYDWWLDYALCPLAQAYISQDGEFVQHTDAKDYADGSISVRQAIQNFRHHYPKLTTISETIAAKPTDKDYPLTAAAIKGLTSLTQSVADVWSNDGSQLTVKGRPAVLHLYSQSLNVAVSGDLGTSRTITLLPIETEVSDTIVYCYDPQNVHLLLSGQAPTMLIGFRDRQYAYPSDLTEIGVRVGRAFLTHEKSGVEADDATTLPKQMLRIPLRNIAVISQASIGVKRVEHNGITFAPLYLVGTNDDQTDIYEEASDSLVNFRTVGRIYDIVARDPDNLSSSNSLTKSDAYVDLYLFSDFQPREGFYYQMRIDFQEEFEAGHVKTEAENAVCDGSLVFSFKIVPEYVKWTGLDGTQGWASDRNWARADKADLQRTDADAYPTNEANGTDHAYVPLDFTRVIVPEVDPDEYYSPTLRSVTGNHDTSTFVDFDPGEGMEQEPHTANIEYDMTPNVDDLTVSTTPADGTTDAAVPVYRCIPFYTTTCRDLYLEAGGQIINAQHLQYSRAYMEYPLTAGRWYTLASPLSRMLSGDWYAPTAEAAETSERFASRTFSTATDNRFSPAVYQKGWDKGKATLYYLNPTDGTEASSLKTDNVALRADWSPVYNDVDASYSAGGFSLKVGNKGTDSRTYNSALFRLPKNDTSFDYYTRDGDGSYYKNNTAARRTATTDAADTLDLTARLKTDSLAAASSFTQTLTAATAASHIFLAGNPFPCGLDMELFFLSNPHLKPRYWLYTAEGQTAAIRNESTWITTGSSADPGCVAPGQGFFVEADADGTELQLTFTPDMQTDAGWYTTPHVLTRPIANAAATTKGRGVRTTAAVEDLQPTLYIEALHGTDRSRAIVRQTPTAANGYRESEDLITLLNSATDDSPTVYTLADSAALTVNSLQHLQRVPLGITSTAPDSLVTLRITGMDTFNQTLSLLDELTGELHPLTLCGADTATVTIPARTLGRYYIIGTDTDDDNPTDGLLDLRPLITATSATLHVSAAEGGTLTLVTVTDPAGRQLYRLAPYTTTLTLPLPHGNYIIHARNQKATRTTKVQL